MQTAPRLNDKVVVNFLIATFLMGLSNGIFDAVYNFFLESRGFDKAAIGRLYAIAMGIMATSVVPLIFVGRKYSHKKLLLFASVLYALPFAALPFLSSLIASAITLGLILSGMIGLLSIGNSLIGSHIAQDRRTALFSRFFISYLGAAMTGSIFVSLVTRYSALASDTNFRALLLGSFGSAALMIWFRAASVIDIAEPVSAIQAADFDMRTDGRNLITLFFAACLLGASITLVFRFANILFNLAYRIDISDISLIMGGDKVISIIGAIFAPMMIKRFSLRPAVFIVGVSTFVCVYAQSAELSLALFVFLYFLRLLLNYCLMPLLDTVAITGFDKSKTLVATSTRQLAFYLGSALSAMLYGDLLARNDWRSALISSATMALVGAGLMTLIQEKRVD